MKLKEIEEKLNKLKLIKFKGDIKFNNIREVLKRACKNCYEDDEITYTITGHYQCGKGKNRGLRDLYRLCKYYFPKLTLKEFLPQTKFLLHSFCNETYQTVHQYMKDERNSDHPKGRCITINRTKYWLNEIEDLK